MILALTFWWELALKLAIAAAVIPAIGMVIGYAEMKLSAHMQSRVGPYFAGGRFGWAQLIADGIKFIQKEDIIPEEADRPVFKWAPALVMMGTMALLVIVPLHPSSQYGIIRDLEVGVFYALAVSSISTVGVLMAGWSSANKYSMIGGLRAAGQLIAYELPLVLATVGVVIQAGTMSMQGIVSVQVAQSWPFVLTQFVGFAIFMIAALAELTRLPFDMPIAESELVMGYVTEYSGFRFLFFFLAEFTNMFTMSVIAVTLFLGGYGMWFIPTDSLLSPLVVFAKVGVLLFLMIWIRWTLPRLREDQLQTLAWKWLIPIAILNIIVTAVLKVVV